jgi:hypothetical protein
MNTQTVMYHEVSMHVHTDLTTFKKLSNLSLDECFCVSGIT